VLNIPLLLTLPVSYRRCMFLVHCLILFACQNSSFFPVHVICSSSACSVLSYVRILHIGAVYQGFYGLQLLDVHSLLCSDNSGIWLAVVKCGFGSG